jgi:ABC-2 type transport system permease protein
MMLETVSTAPDHSGNTAAPRQGAAAAMRSLWTLYTLSLRQHRHGKRWIIMALLLLLPALLALLVRWTDPSVPGRVLEFNLAFMFIPQGLLPLVALVYASGMIHDEQEEQTITYLLLRPISKTALYAAKLLATLSVAVLLVILSTALTYGAIYIGGPGAAGMEIVMRCLTACCIHCLAVTAYCCLFGLLGLLTRRVLIAGIIYIALVEGLLANIPFAIRLITVIYYTRLIAYRFLSFIVPAGYSTQNLAADTWQFNTVNDPTLQNYPHTWACVTILFTGSAVCTVLAALLCRQREFYVKTPEKTG